MATISCSLAEFGSNKYLIVHFFVRFGGMPGSFDLAMGILARLRMYVSLKYEPWPDQTHLICLAYNGSL